MKAGRTRSSRLFCLLGTAHALLLRTPPPCRRLPRCVLSTSAGSFDGAAPARQVLDPELTAARRAALDAELAALGLDVAGLTEDEAMRESPALKAYWSFTHPKASSLDHARDTPVDKSAKQTAQQVAFLARRQRAALADFVRNHDEAQQERERRGLKLFPLIVVCDNVRSAFNVGSILRTAETAGVREVVTCGLTPTPPHEKLKKTAFSAAETVPTRHFGSTREAIEVLKAEGFTVFAMETTARSRSYVDVTYPPKTALVLGNEVTGVDTELLELADGLVEIPTFGLKNSLNVAAACPVVVFEVLRQWGELQRAPEQ